MFFPVIEALHLPTRGCELLLDHVHPPLAPHLVPALAQEGAHSTPSPVPAGGSAAGSFDPGNTRRRCPVLVLAAIRVGSHSGHGHTDVLELQQPHCYCPLLLQPFRAGHQEKVQLQGVCLHLQGSCSAHSTVKRSHGGSSGQKKLPEKLVARPWHLLSRSASSQQ